MKTYFGYSRSSIIDYIDALKTTALSYNWMFVAIDSSRGSWFSWFYENQRGCNILDDYRIEYKWEPSGLWIDAPYLDTAISNRFLVHFSAAYIFPKHIDTCSVVGMYDLTSESERFDQIESTEILESMAKLGAIGYIADGCGLNYCLQEPALGEVALTLG